MTIAPREPSEHADSDEKFLARLGILLAQLESEDRPEPTDIIPALQGMSGSRCGICGGLVLGLDGHARGELVHVEAADRAQPHRPVLRPGQFPHRA